MELSRVLPTADSWVASTGSGWALQTVVQKAGRTASQKVPSTAGLMVYQSAESTGQLIESSRANQRDPLMVC